MVAASLAAVAAHATGREIAAVGPAHPLPAPLTDADFLQVEPAKWRPETAWLPDAPWLAPIDFVVRDDRLETARHAAARDIDLPPRTEEEIAQITAFLEALTGATARTWPMGRPDAVPSGLPVD